MSHRGFSLYPKNAESMNNYNHRLWGWRDGSVVKSTGCSSRGPEFNSQESHGGSQPSVMESDAFFCYASTHEKTALNTLKKKKRLCDLSPYNLTFLTRLLLTTHFP